MTALQFAEAIKDYPFISKIIASNDLTKKIEEANSELSKDELTQLKALDSWLVMNILVGNQLCPPEQVIIFIEQEYKIAESEEEVD